jgi:hypothetical protein
MRQTLPKLALRPLAERALGRPGASELPLHADILLCFKFLTELRVCAPA